MSTVKFNKVNSLPSTMDANALYFVKPTSGSIYDMFVTDSSGAAKQIAPTMAQVNAAISDSLSDYTSDVLPTIATDIMRYAADIAERDSMSIPFSSLVFVKDASDDATVTAGSAMYYYDAYNGPINLDPVTGDPIRLAGFAKIFETESIDINVSWAALSGKPTSTPAQIDAAVTASHTHSNIAILNALSSNSDGLTYNGNNVAAVWSTTAW